MSTEEKTNVRGGLAVVVATAAVTLAIGVTGAALIGYLQPRHRSGATHDAIATAKASEAPPRPSVVLVPVTEQAPRRRPRMDAPATNGPVIAAAKSNDDDDDDEGHAGRAGDETEEEEHEDD